jgi:hypothetical protein
MNIRWRFPSYVFLTVAVVGAIALYPLIEYGRPEYYPGIIVGCIVSVVNVLIGYGTVEHAFDKSNDIFLKYVLGGMVIRLLGTVGAVFLLIFVYDYHIMSLVGSLFFFYFLFLIYEIIYYNKKLILKKEAQHP